MTTISKQILKYGVLVFLLISVFQYSQLLFEFNIISLDTLISFIVIISSALGLLISKVYSYKTKTLVEPINLAPIETTLFTKRELEVLLLLSKGYTNIQISNELFVSPNTTKTHLSNIYSKLGTRNRVQTIRIAQNKGLL